MCAQSSLNFTFAQYEGVNDKSVLCFKFTKERAKTNSNSNRLRFHAAGARRNEIIIFEYLQLCQILDVEASVHWWSDVQRRRPPQISLNDLPG